jgi:hypothetical protein
MCKMNKCVVCGRALVKIGLDRKNGTGDYYDWKSRKTHKKCYKYLIDYNIYDNE